MLLPRNEEVLELFTKFDVAINEVCQRSPSCKIVEAMHLFHLCESVFKIIEMNEADLTIMMTLCRSDILFPNFCKALIFRFLF